MNRLRELIFPTRIYERTAATTDPSTLYVLGTILGLLTIFTFQKPIIPAIALLFAGLVFGRQALRFHLAGKILHARKYIDTVPGAKSQAWASAATKEHKGMPHIGLLKQAEDWSVYDMIFAPDQVDPYPRNRWRYYTVFEAPLSRVAPHLIFDSKKAKGRQFQIIYMQAQRTSFEGEFDNYFESYAPDHYEIDALSFVTPEVMEALLAAKDYDIELVQDRVLVYAPLLRQSDIGELERIGQTLVRELNDNLGRYRDSYLPSRQARKQIMPFARALLESPRTELLGLLPVLVFIAICVLIGATTPEAKLTNATILYALGAFLFFVVPIIYSIIRKMARNKRLKKRFYKDMSAIQSRGRY